MKYLLVVIQCIAFKALRRSPLQDPTIPSITSGGVACLDLSETLCSAFSTKVFARPVKLHGRTKKLGIKNYQTITQMKGT
jgi:hypothetical protein